MGKENRYLKPAVLAVGSILIAVIGLKVFGLQISPVSPSDQNPVARVHFVDNISPAHQRAIDLFNARSEGKIEVVPVNLPFEKFTTNERKELLARSLRSKSDRIDIFAVDQIWVPRFAKWGEPLDRYVTQRELENILGYALESCIYENVLVSMPLYIDIGMMYYRRDLLRELPDRQRLEENLKNSITWDDFIRLRDELGYKNKPFYLFQGNDYEGLVCNYFELLVGQDENFFRNDEMNLNSTSGRSALKFLVDLVNERELSPGKVSEFNEQASYAYMLDHDAVFLRGWPGFVEQFRAFYSDTSKLNNIGRCALPHFEGEKPVSVFGGWNLMISKYSANKEASLEFIRFLQAQEIQKLLFEVGGYIPVNKSVYEDADYMQQNADLKYYRKLLDNGFHRPALEDYTRISDIICHYVHLALKEDLSVSDALGQASGMIRSKQTLIK